MLIPLDAHQSLAVIPDALHSLLSLSHSANITSFSTWFVLIWFALPFSIETKVKFDKYLVFTFLSGDIYDSKRFCAIMIDADGLPLAVRMHNKKVAGNPATFFCWADKIVCGVASAHENSYHQSKLVNAGISVPTYSIICAKTFSISLSVFSAEHPPPTYWWICCAIVSIIWCGLMIDLELGKYFRKLSGSILRDLEIHG